MVALQSPLHRRLPARALLLLTFIFIGLGTLYLNANGELAEYRIRLSDVYSNNGTFQTDTRPKSPGDDEPKTEAFKYSHIALASSFEPWHYDVFVPVARSFENVVRRQDSARLYVVTPYKLGDFGFNEVLNETGIYHGQQYHYNTLVQDMSATSLFPSDPGAMIDVVVFGTCVFDLPYWSEKLLAEWDARPIDKKFKVLCIAHDPIDVRTYFQFEEWVTRGALRYLTISEHVSKAMYDHLRHVNDASSPMLSLSEKLKVDIHIPVLPLRLTRQEEAPRKLSNVVIQGLLDIKRRNYDTIMKDLSKEIKADPGAWGYLPPKDGRTEYRPDSTNLDASPFRLHLLGSFRGFSYDQVPPELKQVVVIHEDLPYLEYFKLMQSMDAVLPAFATHTYYDEKASSTVVMAIQCNVPLLVSRRFRSSYNYADDDRILITRPEAMSDIQAIRALRSGISPLSIFDNQGGKKLLEGPSRDEYRIDVERMMRQGWLRTKEGMEEYKSALQHKNEGVIRKILNDD